MQPITNEQVLTDIRITAESMRLAGATIKINHGLPYVAIELPDGTEYFFQESEAVELLDSVPDNVNEKDYILFLSFAW